MYKRQEKAYAAAQNKRVGVEKALKQIRAKYFRATKSAEMRQVGILEIRKYDDPAYFPLLIELFEDEDAAARRAILDHLCDIGTDEADATVAWTAVFDDDKAFRTEAADRIGKRYAKSGGERAVCNRVKSVVAIGLRSKDDDTAAAAAGLASILKLYEAIPMLINAQVVGGGSGSDNGDGALAYILVGRQVAFVSDLQPVVGDNAVAFDPTVGVVTEGVVLRVIDAFVITYRMDVHAALVGLSSDGWGGQSTAALGWDGKKWHEWYAKEFVPHRAQLAAAAPAVIAPK